uniref:Uncharacterized protein n=1 Tax=Arundo donax TaxID=35708 RepID=A0A0A8YJ43_ARUDO
MYNMDCVFIRVFSRSLWSPRRECYLTIFLC